MPTVMNLGGRHRQGVLAGRTTVVRLTSRRPYHASYCQFLLLQAGFFPRASSNATQATVSVLPMTCMVCFVVETSSDNPTRTGATDQSLELHPRHLAMTAARSYQEIGSAGSCRSLYMANNPASLLGGRRDLYLWICEQLHLDNGEPLSGARVLFWLIRIATPTISFAKVLMSQIARPLIQTCPINSPKGHTWPPMARTESRAGFLTAGTHGG